MELHKLSAEERAAVLATAVEVKLGATEFPETLYYCRRDVERCAAWSQVLDSYQVEDVLTLQDYYLAELLTYYDEPREVAIYRNREGEPVIVTLDLVNNKCSGKVYYLLSEESHRAKVEAGLGRD